VRRRLGGRGGCDGDSEAGGECDGDSEAGGECDGGSEAGGNGLLLPVGPRLGIRPQPPCTDPDQGAKWRLWESFQLVVEGKDRPPPGDGQPAAVIDSFGPFVMIVARLHLRRKTDGNTNL
jgi:hypothetical protein